MRTNRGRRLYVFFAVALAVFISLMTLTGIVCNGFTMVGREVTTRLSNEKSLNRTEAEKSKAKLLDAERTTANALNQYEAVHSHLTEFLTQHFSDLASASTDKTDNNQTLNVDVQENKEMQVLAVPNPAWEKANQQLTDLRHRHENLLANLTESHPLVRQMEFAIADLETQLKGIPQELVENSEKSTIAPKSSLPGMLKDLPVTQADSATRWREAEDQYRNLLQEVTKAEQSYHAALLNEQTERRDAEKAASEPKVVQVVLASSGGANPQLSIYLCGIIAIAVALIVSRHAQLREPIFQTAAEVRQSLGTAVLGVIPRDPYILPREQPKQESKWVHRTVLAAEVILAVAVLLLVISSLVDTQFFLDLITDPLGACSNKFWC